MILYFAYGSNMNQKDLDAYCIKNSRPLINLEQKSPKPCLLKDYRLDFNYYSKRRKGGVANIEPASGECVEGVLFEINETDKKTLDQKEGAPLVYHKIPVTVMLGDGTKIENAITYIILEKLKTKFTAPTKEYKQIIIKGAKAFGLSKRWIMKLREIPHREIPT